MSDRVMSYLPEYYAKVREFAELAGIEDTELEDLEAAVEGLLADQFVSTSGLQTIKRRENMLGIQADPVTESLDFRKRRILNRYQTKPPFTIRYLQQQLDTLVGSGMTIVSVDRDGFILTVTANIENASVFQEVAHTVETIKPAHLVYQQNTSIGNGIDLEEHIAMQELSWNYSLGSWQLGSQPFVTYGAEVVVK
ncbi:hypothetical protein D3C78_890200 [compost metagenome]